jgi:hypothetical protein
VVETPGKDLPVVALQLEEKLVAGPRRKGWEVVDGSLKTRAFALALSGERRVRVELKRKVRLVGEAVITPIEDAIPARRASIAEVQPGDRILVEGVLSPANPGQGSNDGGDYRGRGGWVLRAPSEGDATLFLPSAVGAVRGRGAPLRVKVLLAIGALLAIGVTASVAALPVLGTDAPGEVVDVIEKQSRSSRSSAQRKTTTYTSIDTRFVEADGTAYVCEDMLSHFDRDAAKGDTLTVRYLRRQLSVCAAKGPLTLSSGEAVTLLFAFCFSLIGVIDFLTNRSTDLPTLKLPWTKRDKRRIRAMFEGRDD